MYQSLPSTEFAFASRAERGGAMRIGTDGIMIRGRTVLPLIVSLLAACQHTQSLPHRDESELFPQANSPTRECPGQYSDYVIAHDGTEFFLECWGTQNTLEVTSHE
jgi:hypothetical protein